VTDFDYLRTRYLEYWKRENHDRPLISVTAAVENPKPWVPAPADLTERWENVDYIVTSARRGIENTYFGGEAVPVFNPNLGPDVLGAIAGCDLVYGEGTSWALPCVEDWENHPPLVFDEDNRWWRKLVEITRAAVDDAQGEYLVGITDLHPGTDGLVSLRGPERLCFDLKDARHHINPRIDELHDIYAQIYTRLMYLTSKNQRGTINWMGVWHPNSRWYVTGSDFSCMISENDFEEFVVPGLQNELDFLDASIYHLDGPDALRHLNRLLKMPGVDGIQWVYGAGQPSARHWIPVLKKIQDAGKLVHVACEPEDIEPICEALEPEGVMLTLGHCRNKDEADALVELALKASRRRNE
jgi:hypothetical protein